MRLTHGRMATVSAALTLGALPGCNTPRALPAVRESGERNFRHEQYDNALADYQEYIRREPGDPAVQLELAQTLLQLHQPIEAVEHAQLAYDQRPNHDEYIETLAQAQFEAGHTEDMMRLLRGVVGARGLPSDYIRLGRYLAKSGDADSAETAFKQGARVDGGHSLPPQLALADFYHSISDRASELRRLRMALYLNPSNNDILERIRAMGEIPGPSLALQPEEMESPIPAQPAPKPTAGAPGGDS